jgi:hypothetical protein
MNGYFKLCWLVVIGTGLSSCASLPGGVSRSEWNAMSAAKQAEYRRLQRSEDLRVRQVFDDHRRASNDAIRAIESRVSQIPDP